MPSTADPRPQLRKSLDQVSRVVATVKPADGQRPTPCSEFDVDALLSHIVGAARRIGSIARREPQGELDTAVADSDFGKALGAAASDAVSAWSDDVILAEDVVLPWGTFPAEFVARMYTLEMTVHSWDLATALGAPDLLDPSLAEFSLSFAPEMLPAEMRGGEVPFGPVIAVPGDAPAYDRLAGFMGRSPVGLMVQ
jgi:uncharacterized protein (TIGR03086 family)